MTTFAVATPHALILTVSHGLLFCQPLICAGTDAAVSTRRISPGPYPSPNTVFLHGLLHERARPTYRPFTAPSRSCDLTNPQQSQPTPAAHRGRCELCVICATFRTNARRTDENFSV
jgi:hypothetical protein